MGDVIDDLLSRADVTKFAPASHTDIDAVCRQFDTHLPDLLIKMWQASDGLAIDVIDAHFLGPTEVLQLRAIDAWDSSLIPVFNDHQSNYLTLCARPPLAFRVLHMPHDDGARMLYRNLESCVRSISDAVDAGQRADLFLFDTDGDYPPDELRPVTDQDAAKMLLAGPNEHDEWNHATQLLDSSNLEEWSRLLETGHFVRREVRARMQKMRSPAIRELLRRDERAFEEFATKFIEIVRDAGLQVGDRNGRCVHVGKAWYDLEGFFHRRNITDAAPRMVAWISDQLAGRNPYDRPGNFMTD